MSLLQNTLELAIGLMNSGGYGGLFLLMVLDSMPTPVPSEAVMTFAGYLVYTGRFDLVTAAIVAALGSLVGSLLSYYIGLVGGRPLVLRYGKYMLVQDHHLQKSEEFFHRHGPKAILASRFIPGVRALISVPAGIAKMDIRKFTVYTFVGAAIWDTFLLWVGIQLGENWVVIQNYSDPIEKAVLVMLALLVLRHWWIHDLSKRFNRKAAVPRRP